MQETIRRSVRNLRQSMEDEPTEAIADICLLHFLYGPREGKASDLEPLKAACQVVDFMESLLKEESSEAFTKLLQEFFADGPESGEYVRLFTVEATPSEEAAEALAAEERELVRSREQELGPEGLEKAQEMIEAAQEETQKLASFPNDLSTRLKWPELSSISLPEVAYRYYPLNSSNTKSHGVVSSCFDANGPALLYEAEIVQVDSAFAKVSCIFSTQSLDLRQLR